MPQCVPAGSNGESEDLGFRADTPARYATQAVVTGSSVATPFCFEVLRTENGFYVNHAFYTCSMDKRQVSKYSHFDRTKWPLSFLRERFHAIYINKQDPAIFDVCKEDTIIYYEPDYIDDVDLHDRLSECCHVLKYSHAQFTDCGIDIARRAKGMAIETYGAKGVAFRMGQADAWTHLEARKIPIVDAAGAGDWFSANVLRCLSGENVNGLVAAPKEHIAHVIRHAIMVAGEASMHRSALGLLRDRI
jgi:hypothetical protein